MIKKSQLHSITMNLNEIRRKKKLEDSRSNDKRNWFHHNKLIARKLNQYDISSFENHRIELKSREITNIQWCDKWCKNFHYYHTNLNAMCENFHVLTSRIFEWFCIWQYENEKELFITWSTRVCACDRITFESSHRAKKSQIQRIEKSKTYKALFCVRIWFAYLIF